jgi:hypothetical protein
MLTSKAPWGSVAGGSTSDGCATTVGSLAGTGFSLENIIAIDGSRAQTEVARYFLMNIFTSQNAWIKSNFHV